MKTDDLIRTLAADEIAESTTGRRAASALPACALATAALFYAFAGLRPGLASPAVLEGTVAKLAVTLSLALVSGALALHFARPGARSAALVLLLVPAAVLLALVGVELHMLGLVDWRQRLLGHTSSTCSVLITLLSIPQLAAIFFALASGAADRPKTAGAVAGLAAAGVGASVYALHCPEDSVLFLLAWYGLASAVMAALGAALAPRIVRW